MTIQHQQQRHRPVVFVIFYSTYGHVGKLASSVREGIERAGCDCRVYQVAETLSEEILMKMHAPAKNRDIPVIRPEQLPEADGFLFGMPTRFGSMPAQMKSFFDACGAHWLSDALIGKPVGVCFKCSLNVQCRVGRRVLLHGYPWRWPRDHGSVMCPFLYSSGNDLRSSGLSKQSSDESRRDPRRIALRSVKARLRLVMSGLFF